MRGLLDELVQHFVGDIFDSVGGQLFDKPSQHLFLIGQIAVIKARDFVLEVDKSWEVIDAIFFSNIIVIDFDERDSFLVALVIDVLQFGQDSL